MVINYSDVQLTKALNRLWMDFYFHKVNPETGKHWKKVEVNRELIKAGIKTLSGGSYGSNF